MQEDLKSVLSKVKKLLKLAEGKSNAEESASAAAKAQELIDKYKLEVSDLEAEKLAEEPIEHTTLRQGKRLIWWKLKLAMVIADANNSKAYSVSIHEPIRDKKLHDEIRIISSRSDLEIIRYMFTYLTREIERLAKIAYNNLDLDGDDYDVKPMAYTLAFKLGCVHAIKTKLEGHRAQLLATNSTAMIRLGNQLARVQKEINNMEGEKIQQKTRVNADGFRDGLAAGSNIALNKGLGGSNAAAIGQGRKLLG